ncbi:MAG: NAD(P)(+) transhydrogenase (Re/Si-specific) subunit beta [Leptospiraceae bacterium]|nr:NAD(P)(+) transhydrogenase (Re/Si-specific) subunit beta [Leptospiraceae bacterium]
MDSKIIIQLVYLVASVLFILGIKMMGKTHTARKGNLYSAVAMLLAIVATFAGENIFSVWEIFAAILVGSAIGAIASYTVPMTSMPEMVALFNGVGGSASLLVAFSEYSNRTSTGGQIDTIIGSSIAVSILIGAITFTGSLIAYGKLSGKVTGKAVVFPLQHFVNLGFFVVAVVFAVLSIMDSSNINNIFIMTGIALLLGVLLVIPIGGADMPVVISLLNSYSGMAGCATGFVLNNYVLVISGALVGSSGIILTQIMCKAMNRSLMNVLLGGFGQTAGAGGGPASSASGKPVKEVGVEEAAMMFDNASSVIIVPGYGMAVAQAQHAVRDLMNFLEKNGTTVQFAIHPVAGRMPGHMNVLLAEAEVSYDKLVEMDLINSDFSNTDIVLVVGANDIVNPAARNNPSSPIYGMPILNADKAKTVIISKRSMAAGYAGIDNELFTLDNSFMLFGDAKATISKLVKEMEDNS